MLSYWEKAALLEYDLVVLGGGITGMFCALTYREHYPEAQIAILERGLFSSGASTKNAGFACFGSLSELVDDTKNMNTQDLINLVQLRIEGLSLLKDTLGERNIDFQSFGGYELFFEQVPQTLEKMDEINKLLHPLFGKTVFNFNKEKVDSFGFNKNHVHHLIENSFEGQIHTGKMMRTLRAKVNCSNIDYFSCVEAKAFDLNKNKTAISLKLKDQAIELKTVKLAICTNAFTDQFFPEIKLKSGRGIIIMTKPIANLKVKGTFHYKDGYYYFRNIGNQILLGGGRELDFENENTVEFGLNQKIKQKLINDLRDFILPDHNYEIETEWSGIMAFGKNKIPLIEKKGDCVALGVRMGGMGIAIGSKIGQATARLLFD